MKYLALTAALVFSASVHAAPRACPNGQHAVCVPDLVAMSGMPQDHLDQVQREHSERPRITRQLNDATVGIGETATFTISATNYDALQWQWKYERNSDWKNISEREGGKGKTYTQPPATKGMDRTQFRVVLTKKGGNRVVSRTATLRVNAGGQSTPQQSHTQSHSSSGSSSGFLKSFVNPEKHRLPANKIYPMGQRMLLTAWNTGNVGQIVEMHNHGFTAIGPFENAWPSSNKNLLAMYTKAKQLNMRAWSFLHNQYVLVYKMCDAIKKGTTNAQFAQKVDNILNVYLKPPYNDITDMWLLLPEEMASRLNTCSRSKLLQASEAIITKIKSKDRLNRPIIRTQVEGNSVNNIKLTDKHVGTPALQHYFERFATGDSYKYMTIAGYKAKSGVDFTKALNAQQRAQQTRFPNVIFGAIYPPKDNTRRGAEKYVNYYLWSYLASGYKGFSFYKMDKIKAPHYKPAFWQWVKTITSKGFEQAFLWGTPKPSNPIAVRQVSGPSRYSWRQGNSTYSGTSLQWAERQYEDKRYVVIVNHHFSQAIKVDIKGIPSGLKIDHILNPSTTIPANGVKVFRVTN